MWLTACVAHSVFPLGRSGLWAGPVTREALQAPGRVDAGAASQEGSWWLCVLSAPRGAGGGPSSARVRGVCVLCMCMGVCMRVIAHV